jgi:vitamin K-dependent gamma-carboxylase
MRARLADIFFRPIDIASLAVFRIFFGVAMAYDTARYISYGWVYSHYLQPPLSMKFIGFQWVQVLPAPLMYAVFGVMVAAAISIAAGFYYRMSCFIFALGHTYVFLVAAEYYLNHGYLISVFSTLMIFVPAHRALSVDALRVPGLYSRTISAWPVWLLLGLVSVVYVFGAVAKVNADWFAGEPLRHWLAGRAQTSVLGDLLRNDMLVLSLCYMGVTFDLFAPALLLWRRTRWLGIITSASFHLSNAYLFNIGIFPWFMLAATTLFFHPSWPRSMPLFGKDVDEQLERVGRPQQGDLEPAATVSPGKRRAIAISVAAFAALMIFLPLRHHLYPGDVTWTEEGHYFSWRMKLRHKEGTLEYLLTDKSSGRSWTVTPKEQLTERQQRKVVGHPDLMLQYAHYLRDAYRRDHGIDVAVHANTFVGLNYRKPQRFVDQHVDLAQQSHGLMPYDWILPFERTPLPPRVAPVHSSLGAAAERLQSAAILRRRVILPPGALRVRRGGGRSAEAR